MPKRFLIDATDPRFLIPSNADVIDFIRRANPFAHSDVGTVLLTLGKELPGVSAYSPSYKDCAYVVLHTEADRIFAIAYGQRGLAFRLAPATHEAAVADSATPAPAIGADWFSFAPYDTPTITGTELRLRHWCGQAFSDANGPQQ